MGRKKIDLSFAERDMDALGKVDAANPYIVPEPSSGPDQVQQQEAPRQEYTSSDVIPFNHFAAVDLRVAEILEVEDVPGARKPLYKLQIDVGELGRRQLVAGIKAFYTKEELIGRRIIIVANLQPKPIAGIPSQGMLLAAEEGENVSLIKPDKDMRPGCKIG